MLAKINSHINLSRLMTIALSLVVMGFIASCESSTDPDDDHMAEISFSYSPTPPVTGTEITFLFEAEGHDGHTSLMDTVCEIHSIGDVTLAEGETGHYSGTHTFAQAGTYELHFSYMDDGMAMEKEFSITVN